MTEPPRNNLPEEEQTGGQTPADQGESWLSGATWALDRGARGHCDGLARRPRDCGDDEGFTGGPGTGASRLPSLCSGNDLSDFGAPAAAALTLEEVLQSSRSATLA